VATSIQQAFVKLKENLEITNLQTTVVSARQNHVRDVVEAEMTVLDTFLTGSYVRSTMIAPLKEADVDVFVVLDAKYFHHYDKGKNGGQAGLLDLLKRTLRRTFTRTPDISRSGQAVTIRFDDFIVDVVPGFNRQGGGYLIPNSITQKWISTNPKTHVDLISSQNKWHDGSLVPLIKMIKAWNKSHDGFFRSFHLEVMAYRALAGVKISDFPAGVRFYFGKAQTMISEVNLDPAGYGGDIRSYLDTPTKIQESRVRFQRAYEQAMRAEQYSNRGAISDSMRIWKLIFSDYFPAYG